MDGEAAVRLPNHTELGQLLVRLEAVAVAAAATAGNKSRDRAEKCVKVQVVVVYTVGTAAYQVNTAVKIVLRYYCCRLPGASNSVLISTNISALNNVTLSSPPPRLFSFPPLLLPYWTKGITYWTTQSALT